MKFTKMHGCGNDYIYFDCFREKIDDPAALAIRLSDRHFGIGGDGVVLICPSDIADVKMRMFNADGSEGKMCGNAIRCVAKYYFENHVDAKTVLTVETLSGIRTVEVNLLGNTVVSATVDMGKAILNPRDIPADFPGSSAIGVSLNVGGKQYHVTCVSMGNPHCVTFVEDVANFPLEKIGPLFETDLHFPERVNTEFARVIDRRTLEMRVWERGSGETFACGTGACATVVAACENGFCDKGVPVTVQLRGGILTICYTDDAVTMNGGAVKVYDGEIKT